MSYLEYSTKYVPKGWRKVLHLNWGLLLLMVTVSGVGFLMLYSVSGGNFSQWAEPQIQRFGLGLAVMFAIAMTPVWFWRNVSVVAYGLSIILLLLVPVLGVSAGGAQRWIDLGFMRLQPSEIAKITLVMVLAAYYDWLPLKRTSKPLWVLAPVVMIIVPSFLVIQQPDLGTALLLMTAGAGVMFFAGVHWGYFIGVITAGATTVWAVFASRGTENQLLKDYQYDRIDIFLDPSLAPLKEGYNFAQATIALGSGGLTGKGFMQGTQTRLDFLPEKHTDFIFTTLAEEFGFLGTMSLLILYMLILAFCLTSAFQNRDRFAALLTLGITLTFFLFFSVNMAMVTGLAPVVGVPLPLVSYGGTAMLVLLGAFGLVQSAHVHRPRGRS